MTKKIIERYIPVLVVGEEGNIKERPLKPRDTIEKAEEALKAALIKEQPGCMGEIRRVFVCVVEEKSSLILPNNIGKLTIVN